MDKADPGWPWRVWFYRKKSTKQAEFQKTVQTALEMGAQMREAPEILRIEQKQFLFEYEIRSILSIESYGKQLLIHTAILSRFLMAP